MTKALLALANGDVFYGSSIGAPGSTVGEVVFNTAMTGYQEILTDASYKKQIVALTCPNIGNVGINSEDCESSKIMASGLIIRENSIVSSNWRSQKTLSEYLTEENIIGITGIDTRRLTRVLRDQGSQSGYIVTGDNIDEEASIKKAQEFAGLSGLDLAKEVTTEFQYHFSELSWNLEYGYKESDKFDYHVVVYDYGVKTNILRMLVDRNCQVTVVPATMSAAEVLDMDPDGVFLSNGPGDPEPCDYAQTSIKTLLDNDIPMFGICLGHQLLALSLGAKTKKMKFGHHGANHPVQDLNSGKVVITSQNHGFTVIESSLPDDVATTHKSLFDQSLQGFKHIKKPVFGFQGHPEASPGPHDLGYLFDNFIALMAERVN